MKAIISGGRNYIFDNEDIAELDRLHAENNFTEIVSGVARGADTCGEMWANMRGIPIKRFYARWNSPRGYDPQAGKKRNEEMARYGDICVAFPGGRGTQHMIHSAEKNKLKVILIEREIEDDEQE